mgnify:CR=1 FL=1
MEKNMKHYNIEKDMRYLQLLSQSFPTIAEASTEIINLQAILNLPKGTEHFLADIHGEYEAFLHVLKNASGNIKRKVNELFGNTLREQEKRELCSLIYYPEQKLELVKQNEPDINDWYHITLHQLVAVCRDVSSKYTRSKVRKSLPCDFSYIIQELLHEHTEDHDKTAYVNVIVDTIISTGRADDFIIAIANVIQRLAIDQLHILGDIYDRGPGAHIILDKMRRYHSWDIQWGNHDVLWMGAAAGNLACICNVLRIAISYNSFDVLEDGYGINLRPLSMFAAKVYQDDPCVRFMPKILDENIYDAVDPGLAAKMHKAIAVIQFKVEEAMMQRHPEYEMENRMLLTAVDYKKGTVTIEGKEYPMLDMNFPTIDPRNPLELTRGEKELLRTLCASFRHSEVLQRQVKFIYSHGGIYKCYNSNLLYHGCIPMTKDGAFDTIMIGGNGYKGKSLMDFLNRQVHNAYFLPDGADGKEEALDLMWYLWCGARSPVFGKSKMTTFEHYFVEDKATHKEVMNPYYKLCEKVEICDKILEEFGLKTEGSHIINGHVPVKLKDGEKPVKAGGKLFVIDGGLSKAYQSTTGIAGYTLIYNSHHLALAEHMPFDPKKDSTPKVSVVEKLKVRIMVADTDKGRELKEQIADLKELVAAYREGVIKERAE